MQLLYYEEVNVWHRHSLSVLHEFYKSYGLPPIGLKILEFGAGPVISYEISSVLYASDIVLSEYWEKNRKVLQMWLDRDPKAPNWKPFFLSMSFRSWKERAKKRLQRGRRNCDKLSKR